MLQVGVGIVLWHFASRQVESQGYETMETKVRIKLSIICIIYNVG